MSSNSCTCVAHSIAGQLSCRGKLTPGAYRSIALDSGSPGCTFCNLVDGGIIVKYFFYDAILEAYILNYTADMNIVPILEPFNFQNRTEFLSWPNFRILFLPRQRIALVSA